MNRPNNLVLGLVVTTVALTLTTPAHAASFQGLGDLPGGIFSSTARDVSADGTTVVGDSSSSSSTNGVEALIWDRVNGMVGLGDLPGGEFRSEADSVSADGFIVVGGSVSGRSGEFGTNNEAFIWDSVNGMVGLGQQFSF